MNCEDVTPVVLTWNEEPNLARCLERLRWAKRVVVVDSLSTDETKLVASRFANVSFLERRFDDHAAQWNFGLEAVTSPWVLSLDADYRVPETFSDELRALEPDEDVDAFLARFRYCVFGKALRGTLYPPRAALFRKARCSYENDGHTQRLVVKGGTGSLTSVIDHDDRKPLSRWFASQDKYALLEAGKLAAAHDGLRLQDRLRKWIVIAPALTFFYCLFYKLLIFDGWRGWFYTGQRVTAELMLSLHLLERKLKGEGDAG